MTFEQFEAFLAVYECGGLRSAAEKLHKSQPALTTALKNLEDQLGLKLFDRSQYRMRLSPYGRYFLPKIQAVLEQIKEIDVQSKEINLGHEMELKVAIDYLCPLARVLKVVRSVAEKYPKTNLDLSFEVLSGAEDKVLRQGFNLALSPFVKERKNLVLNKLFNLDLVAVISKKLVKNKIVTEEDIKSWPQIFVEDTSLDTEKKLAERKALQDTKIWYVSDHMIKRQLIYSGFGWGHVSRSSVEKDLKSNKLVEVLNKNKNKNSYNVYMFRSKSKAFGPVSQALWTAMEKEFSS